MHIPDGYLSPQTYVPLYAATFGFWAIALRKLKETRPANYIPYLGMAAAFSFLLQMFVIPAPGVTTEHPVGAGAAALLLGPWTAVIAVSTTIVMQAFLLGDGGITAIGANCFNMAVAMPFVSYGVFRLGSKSKRKTLWAFFAGYAGLFAASLLAAIELGIQPLIAKGADGRSLYAPYPGEVTVPAMAAAHLIFGLFEGIVTALVVGAVKK